MDAIPDAIPVKQVSDPKVIRAWCMFDWANSVYNLVITATFFPIYFLGVTKAAFGEDQVPFWGMTFTNSSLYDYSLAFAYLAIALLLPILSSIADSRGNKKQFMQFFSCLGALSCMGMFWFQGENIGFGVGCFVFAVVGYVGSLVFYNSYLPEIAAPEDRDKVSARGFAMGYIGSMILQIIGFGAVLYFNSKGDRLFGSRLTFLLVGIWWIGFSQITFAYLPKSKPASDRTDINFLKSGFIELGKVLTQVKKMGVLKWYLTSFFFYSMGVQTVMLAATVFGSKELGLPAEKLILAILMIQLLAVAGAFIMSRLSGTFGNLPVLMGVVVMWMILCFAAYWVAIIREGGANVEVHFYGLACGVGLIMGGIQSLSRSTYSKLMPVTQDTASFFSFYDVMEKIAIVIGVFTFGIIDEMLGMKNSVLSLIVFFVLGFLALLITRRKELQANKVSYTSKV